MNIPRLSAVLLGVCLSCAAPLRSDAAHPSAAPVIAPAESLLHCPFQWPDVPKTAVNDEFISIAKPYQIPVRPLPGSENSSVGRDNTFQSLMPKATSRYKGVFVYAPSQSFVFRAVGVEGFINGQRMDTAVYGAIGGEITNPKFSPNGKYISYDVGSKGLYSKFDIMVWDMFGKKAIKVAKEVMGAPLYSDYRWSPDGEQIAYLFGGEFDKDSDDLGLIVFDVASNQERSVVDVTVRQSVYTFFGLKPFSWFNKDEILYSTTDGMRAPKPKYEPQYWEPNFPHSAIYKINVETRQSTKLIDDAFAPHPSPDGKWIAFIGWTRQSTVPQKRISQPPPAKKTNPSPQAEKPAAVLPLSLYLFNTETKNVTLINGVKIGVADQNWLRDLSLAWAPDSHSLAAALYFEESIRSPDDTYTIRQTQSNRIYSIHLPQASGQAPIPHLLQEMKFEGFRPHWWKPFALHSILRDNRTAFLVRKGFTGTELRNDEEEDLILALDLQTGAISNVAKFSFDLNNMDGWDWAECAP